MDPTTNSAFIIFAAISPLLISLVKQSGFSRQVNSLIALACYIVVGIVGALLSGQPLTIENAVELIATATVVGSAAYALVWSKIGQETEADLSLDDRLTAATSIVK